MCDKPCLGKLYHMNPSFRIQPMPPVEERRRKTEELLHGYVPTCLNRVAKQASHYFVFQTEDSAEKYFEEMRNLRKILDEADDLIKSQRFLLAEENTQLKTLLKKLLCQQIHVPNDIKS